MRENESVRVAFILFLIAGVLSAQVQNAADAAAGLEVSAPVAPGSLAFITDYAPTSPASINGAAVSIRPVGSSTPIPAQVVDATYNGLTFFVPPDTPLGNAQLIYNQAGQLTQWMAVTIVASDFSLYRSGIVGPVNAINVTPNNPASQNGLANPAQPGQAVEIFGTGLSAIPQALPQITLGGVAQTVLYAGDAPGQPGVIQINFQIAPATPDGCYVPLNVTWGTSTATSFLSVTSGGATLAFSVPPCQHPFGLQASTLQTLDNGGTVATGWIQMTTALTAADSNHASRQESADVLVINLSASQIANYFAPSQAQGCSTSPSGPSGAFWFGSDYQFGVMTLRSSNAALTVPASGAAATILPSADAPLNDLPAPVIGGGDWTWSVSGGSDLPASSFSFYLAPPVQISGGAPISIRTGQNQTITWNGSGFDSGANVLLTLSGQNSGPTVSCFAPAQNGTITIPGNMLTQFTSGGVGSLNVSVAESGANIPHGIFALSDGTQLLMLVLRTSSDTRPVDFK